jgi:uroporphyrin-3 C-methyltransferase
VPEAGGWQRLQAQARVWADRLWVEVRDEARDLLRVSRIDQPEALLLAPDQAMMLRQNLKMQLLNARLALLGRQIPVAQVDVLATAAAVRRYFDDEAAVTRNMLKSLAQIQTEMKSTDLPRPTETLAALATAAGGR